jgi:V8-like Glu-specific endopeptidase
MNRATGMSARSVAVALAMLAAAFPAGAAATPPPVYELRASPGTVDRPLRVAGRSPEPRFQHAQRAGASSVLVEDPSAVGTRTNGKIVAVDRRIGPYSCSGTALNTPSRSIVLTAGHCVTEGGRQARRIAFVPAYDHGKSPFGTFKVKSVYVMPQWRRRENPNFDLAALRVAPTRRGIRLTDMVGGRGYATLKSRFVPFQIFGYPAARAGGEELRSCRAHGLGIDRLTSPFPGPPTMPASCDMAAGASGGAWLFDGQYVSGVTSYGYQGRPTQLFSPYFGREVGAFLQALP